MDKLDYYRKKIDAIDRNIAKFLSQRFKAAQQISKFKKINKIKILNKKRELQVLNNIKRYSNKKHKNFATRIFKEIISYSKKMQK